MTDKELIRVLVDALEDAEGHLDYCGYGDSYERECANNQGLPEKIETALQHGKDWMKKNLSGDDNKIEMSWRV